MEMNKKSISLSIHQVLDISLNFEIFLVFSILKNHIEKLLGQFRKQKSHFLCFREAVGDAIKRTNKTM